MVRDGNAARAVGLGAFYGFATSKESGRAVVEAVAIG
jgi:hypothetical protein